MAQKTLWLGVVLTAALLTGGCKSSPEVQAAKFLANGKRYYTARDYRRAILEFKNASGVKPRDAEIRYQLGMAYSASGDLASALAQYRKAIELNPQHSEASAKLSGILVATQDPGLIQQSEEYALRAVNADPNSGEALSALAMVELKTGKPTDATRHFEQALEKMPQSLKAAANLASIKVSKRDFAGAEEVLKKAVAQAPKSSKPPIALGRFYLVVNRPADAEAQFRKALELDPKDAVAMRDLAEFLQMRGQTAAAEEIYKRLSSLPYAASKPLYAAFLTKIGKHQEAAAELERLLAQDPKNRELRTQLVSEYFSTGRMADARRVIDAALKQNPKDSQALLQRAVIAVSSGKFDDVEKDVLAVLHLQPDSAVAHYLMAKVHQARGDSGNRRQELDLALRSSPALLAARLELNQAMVESNSAAAALDMLNQAPPDQKRSLGYIVSRNWTLMALTNWAELRKGIDEGLKLGPASELLLQDGMLRVQERDFKNAQKSLEKVLERNPEDLRALKVLVGSYVLQNQKDAALPTVQAHVQRRPKSALLQNYLGQMLLADGKPAQAMAAFLAAKAADPNSQAADLSLAQVDVVQGNIDRAQQKLLALAAANGGDVSALLALASVEQTAKRTEQAGDHYRAVLEKDANNLIALNNYAFLLSETPGRTDEALKYAQHAKELAPNDPMISDTLGWIYVQKKMYKPAIEQLETALSKRQMAPIYYHLGVAYLQAGDRARSRELLTSALKLDPTLSDATAALRLAGSGLR